MSHVCPACHCAGLSDGGLDLVQKNMHLADRVRHYGQRMREAQVALYDCMVEAGEDMDGAEPHHFPNLATDAVAAVRRLRKDYDDALEGGNDE